MQFQVKHRFQVTEGVFWDRYFFDQTFNRELYLDGLGFRTWEVLSEDRDDRGRVERVVRIEPNMEIPAVLRRVIGDSLLYEEHGVFEPQTGRWSYKVKTARMSDKMDITGDFWLEPAGDTSVDRFCTVDIKVRLFGVGKVLEGVLESSIRDTYEEASKFTQARIEQRSQGG